MSHDKNTTISAVESLGDTHIVIYSEIGPEGSSRTHAHKMPRLTLAIRAAEYGLDVEDPFALDLVMREHLYLQTGLPRYEVDQVHPLFYLPSVAEALAFMQERIEEVRVDRQAPAEETGNRMIANAVLNKAATKAAGQVRSHLLKSCDKRIIAPVQDTRDQLREETAQARSLSPVEQFIARHQQTQRLRRPATDRVRP
jgi:hypothetical protein